MAGDWIKMRMDLPDDPAVYKLAAMVKLDRLSIVGRLYAFWAWADKHAVDGRVDGATSLVVDDITRHEGFADALVAVNWLVLGDDYIALPNHERHNGESAKERGLKNARQARWREGKDKVPPTNVDASPSTKPSTREEKRREESSSLRSEDTAEFDAAWSAYPNRPGASKTGALKAWSARLKAGVKPADMRAGVERYAAYCKASGTEPRFIKQPATFFGPDEHFRSDWTYTPTTQRSAPSQGRYAAAAAGIFGAPDQREVIDV